MAEYDFLTWILTGAIAITTFFVYRATKSMAKTTKEVGSYSIRPRISIVGHSKIGSDAEHDYYEFRMINNGMGNAFDIRITLSHTGGSTNPPIVNTVGVNAALPRITDKSIDKDTIEVKFKITYHDIADNPYSQEFSYNLKDNSSDGYSIMV